MRNAALQTLITDSSFLLHPPTQKGKNVPDSWTLCHAASGLLKKK
jgi:hypothetical protein